MKVEVAMVHLFIAKVDSALIALTVRLQFFHYLSGVYKLFTDFPRAAAYFRVS